MAWTSIYGTEAAFTTTALDAVASSTTLLAGWTSASITSAADDYLISGTFNVESASLSAGRIHVYVYATLTGSTWPDIFSAGTPGTQGTATVRNAQMRDASMRLLWATDTTTAASLFYSVPKLGVAALFNNVLPPVWAVFITQSTGQALEGTGTPNKLHNQPIVFAGP